MHLDDELTPIARPSLRLRHVPGRMMAIDGTALRAMIAAIAEDDGGEPGRAVPARRADRRRRPRNRHGARLRRGARRGRGVAPGGRADGGAEHGGEGVPQRGRGVVRAALRDGADAGRRGGQGQGRRSTTPTWPGCCGDGDRHPRPGQGGPGEKTMLDAWSPAADAAAAARAPGAAGPRASTRRSLRRARAPMRRGHGRGARAARSASGIARSATSIRAPPRR